MVRRIPFIQQLEISDCGAACLAMSLGYHGRSVSPEEIRRATRTSRDGVGAKAIVEAARSYGLEPKAVRVELEALKQLKRGAILHWEFNHFVVLDRVGRDAVDILDPAVGRMRVPMERFSRSFTGIAIDLVPGADFQKNARRRKQTWRYLEPLRQRSGLLSKVLVMSLLIQVFALATPIMMGVVVDRVIPTGDRDLLLTVAVGLAAMVLFFLFSTLVRGYLLVALRSHLDLSITTGFISHLVKLPYQFFLQRSTGDLMARLNSNATVREILTSGSISTLLDGALVTIYLVLIVAQYPPMGLVVLGLAGAQIAILLIGYRPVQRVMTESLQAQARSQGQLAQMITGIETLKSVGAEARAVNQWSALFVDELNASVARGRVNTVIETLSSGLRLASPLLVLTVGVVGVLNNDLTLGMMLALTALATGFLTPLANLVAVGMQMQVLGSYMDRINDVLETNTEQDPDKVVPAPRLSGQITLSDVSFSYGGEGSPEVVRNISLEIEAGRSIAIVGESGSGKSTLAHLILGLYKPTSGSILYDGHDVGTLEAESVRKQLGIVPQDSFLFGTTIRANITLTHPDASNEEIERAAQLAAIHEDIMAMPLGYETVLADGGASLSGGQRQRIALARALIHDPPILLLDEATSSLDAVTESKIYENLEALPCTRIVIAHRLSTIARADLILLMDAGKFVESGVHEDLMRMRGRYHDLVASQERPAASN